MRIQNTLTLPLLFAAGLLGVLLELILVPSVTNSIAQEHLRNHNEIARSLSHQIHDHSGGSLSEVQEVLQTELKKHEDWMFVSLNASQAKQAWLYSNQRSNTVLIEPYNEIVQAVKLEFLQGNFVVGLFPPKVNDVVSALRIFGWGIVLLLVGLYFYIGYHYTRRVHAPAQHSIRKLNKKFGITGSDNRVSDFNDLLGLIEKCNSERRPMLDKVISSGRLDGLSPEYYMNAILENIIDGIITTDSSGVILSANSAVENLTGYSATHLLGKNISILMQGEDKERHDYYLERYAQTRIASIIGQGREVVGRKKNGEIVFLELAVSELRYQDDVLYVGIMRDVSARKQAELARRESEDRFREIFESTKDGIVILNGDDFEFRSSNKQFRLVMGLSEQQVLVDVLGVLFPEGNEASSIKNKLMNISEGQRRTLDSVLYRMPNGSQKFFDITSFQLSVAHQKLVVMMFNDITHKVQSEKALQSAKELAEQSNVQKSEFLANMTHEIRTPMNGLLGMLDLLQSGELKDHQVEELGIAQRCGKTLMTLLNDILDMSKIEANKLVFEKIAFSPAVLIEDVTRLMRNTAEEKSLLLTHQCSPDMPSMLVGDPTRIRQILANLVNNAIKFTDQGTVTIEASYAKSDEPNGGALQINVHDTGMGIAQDKIESLFEKFTQADGSITRRFGGTGLGLNICRGLTQAMQGAISATSVLEKGSTFTVVLPLDYQQAEPDADTQNEIAGDLEILLLMDSEAETNCMLKEFSGDYSVSSMSAGGDSDVVLSGSEKNKIVLVNYTPDNIKRYQSLCKETGEHWVRGIAISPTAQRGEAQEAKMKGLHGYLAKPFEIAELKKIVDTLALHEHDDSQILTRFTAKERRTVSQNKILIVEDNIVNQKVVAGMLAKLGYEVDIRDDGAAAQEAIKETEYALILMDIQMPVMDGVTATQKIREAGSNVPVIALTANNVADERERYLNAGMQDCLAKPIQMQLLKSLLEKYL